MMEMTSGLSLLGTLNREGGASARDIPDCLSKVIESIMSRAAADLCKSDRAIVL